MKTLVVANWKMNPPSLKEAKKLFEETKRMAGFSKGVSVVVAPPSIFLHDIVQLKKGGKVEIAAQHGHFETKGSFTGEVSIAQLHDAKATHLIVGHAERRMAGETNDDTRRQIAVALTMSMTPIFCIGEKERAEGGAHFAFVKDQLLTGLADVPANKLVKIIIAYEPVWAIGASAAMRPHDMHEMSIFIKKTLVEKFGDVGHKATILYGGAVDAGNAQEMLAIGGVKGFLVGRVSVDAKTFTELLRAVSSSS